MKIKWLNPFYSPTLQALYQRYPRAKKWGIGITVLLAGLILFSLIFAGTHPQAMRQAQIQHEVGSDVQQLQKIGPVKQGWIYTGVKKQHLYAYRINQQQQVQKQQRVQFNNPDQLSLLSEVQLYRTFGTHYQIKSHYFLINKQAYWPVYYGGGPQIKNLVNRRTHQTLAIKGKSLYVVQPYQLALLKKNQIDPTQMIIMDSDFTDHYSQYRFLDQKQRPYQITLKTNGDFILKKGVVKQP